MGRCTYSFQVSGWGPFLHQVPPLSEIFRETDSHPEAHIKRCMCPIYGPCQLLTPSLSPATSDVLIIR